MTSTSTAPMPARKKAGETRELILTVARRLFILKGIDGVSYGDIAGEVGSTRANLHYHFGNKSELVREVFALTFREVRENLGNIWLSPGLTLEQRLDLALDDARSRFSQFNSTTEGRTPWSLSSRIRFDFSVVDVDVMKGMDEMSRYFEDNVAHAVRLAIGSGELVPETPVEDVVLMIMPLWYFGSPMTQFAGIKRLESYFTATKNVIRAAYGVAG